MSISKIRLLSDIHTEFSDFTIPKLPTDNETVLVLAGDIGVVKSPYTYKNFIADNTLRFKHVVYIMGNHEHYNGKFSTTVNKVWNELLDFENVSVLEKEHIVIDGVAFIGATMWASMNNHDTWTKEVARLKMNDYMKIRHGPIGEPWKRKLTPADTSVDHIQAVNYIVDETVRQKQSGNKVVVVTHHAPSFKSIPTDLKVDPLNGAYASELFYTIEDMGVDAPDVWCHGHLHNSSDYMMNNTRVVCNPRGYITKDPTDANVNFNPTLLLEI